MEDIDKLLSTPKKKKLTTTSQYIYTNLFQVWSSPWDSYHKENSA